MCKWYCTSDGPSTNLECLHCHAHYCAACLHGDGGKLESLIKCATCGKKPRVQPAQKRATWKGESQSGSTAAGAAYTPSTALKRASSPTKSGSGKPSIFDKLTDPTLYTGTHVHRFDAGGNGRGLEGRDSVAKGSGHVPQSHALAAAPVVDMASILRADAKVGSPSSGATRPKTAIKSPSKSPANKPSIFDKLTDSSLYTGAHKARFDSGGNGRGMYGRDAASGIEYGSSRVTSLAQITRTNLR